MREKDQDKLDEIENKIKVEMASFSREYWDKAPKGKKEAKNGLEREPESLSHQGYGNVYIWGKYENDP